MTSVKHLRPWKAQNRWRDRWIVFLLSGTFFCHLFTATPASSSIAIPPPTLAAQKLCKELGFCEELRWHVLMLNKRGRLFGIEELGHRSISLPGGGPENMSEEVGPEHDPRYYRKAREYIHALIKHASELSTATDVWQTGCREHSEEYVAYPKDGKRRILIFVHGGLNSVDGALDRANRLYLRILCAGSYPIFINWNSGLWSSYAEHLFSIRQGRHHNFFKDRLPGIVTFPFYFIADVAGSVMKSPLSTGQLRINDIETSRTCPPLQQQKEDWLCGDDPTVAARYLNQKFQWNIVMAEDTRSFGEEVLDTARLLISQPTKTLAAAVAVQAGAEAWTDMLRRIDVAFRTDEDFQLPVTAYQRTSSPDTSQAQGRPITGGLALFLYELTLALRENQLEQQPTKRTLKLEHVDITLVAHSMGAILLNRSIRRFGPHLPVSQIVYMAAACTLKDYEETIWPYIRSRQAQEWNASQKQFCEQTLLDQFCSYESNQQEPCLSVQQHRYSVCTRLAQSVAPRFPVPTFYNLMLHPKAEAREVYSLLGGIPVPYVSNALSAFEEKIIDFAPRGSLLVWIDGLLTNPPTPIDRALGRFTNFMLSADRTPKDVSSRIRPTVFGLQQGKEPTIHGDFSSLWKFWKEECWMPGASLDACSTKVEGQ